MMSDNDNNPLDITGVLPENLELHPDFGDVESMWNMRQWLRAAIEAKGAKQTGAGMGMGEADIDFVLEGHKFNVVIKAMS